MRPTTDKLRSAIFSIIESKVIDADIYDSFAGTGAFGIEAISRGAKHVTFTDIDLTSLKSNLTLIEKSSYTIAKGNYYSVIKSLKKSFDIIFIDPPYEVNETSKILEILLTSNSLKKSSIIIYEEFYKTPFIYPNELMLVDERRYGDTTIRFLELK